MVQIGYLNAKFDADVASFIKDMGRAADATEKTQKLISGSIKMMNGALAGLGVTLGAGAIFGKMLEESKQAEAAAKKIEAVLRATGGVAGITAQQIDNLADKYSKLTGIDDDVIKGGQALLLTFKNIGKDAIGPATEAMLDLSETMGQDLKTSAVQLGKALNDPVKGVTALQKVGVSFTESQKDLIKSLVNSGQAAKAQALILRELQSEMGGTATAARDTLDGALKALDTTIGNLFESMGTSGALDATRFGIEALISAIEMMTEAMQKADFKQWLNEIQTGFETAWEMSKPLIDALGKIADLVSSFDRTRGALAKGDLLGLITGGFNLAASTSNLTNGSTKTSDAIQKWFDGIQEKIAQQHERAKKAGSHLGKEITGGFTDVFASKEVQKDIEKSLHEMMKPIKGLASNYDPINDWRNRKLTGETKDPIAEAAAARGKIAEALSKELDLLDEQVDRQRLIAEHNDKALMHLEAEKQVMRAMGPAYMDTAEAAQKRADATAAIAAKLEEIKRIEEAGKWSEKIKSMHEENDLLIARLQGREKEYELEKKIAEIRDNQFLDATQKDKIIDDLKRENSARESLIDLLEQQKKTLDDIKSSTGGYLSKQRELYNAWNQGKINGKQYVETLEEIRKKQIETVQKGVRDWTNKIFDGFASAITEGKKLKDVFKDLGKELGLLAAKKLLFEPVANAISNWAGKLYGGTMFGAPGSSAGTAASAGGGILGGFGLFGGGKAAQPSMAGSSGSVSGNSSGLSSGGALSPANSGGLFQTGPINLSAAIEWMQKGVVDIAETKKLIYSMKPHLIDLRNELKYAEVSTAGGTAIRVWVANQGGTQPGSSDNTAFKNPFRSSGDGSGGGTTIDLGQLIPLITALIGSTKDGPAWRVVMPECPCPPGAGMAGMAGGNIGGLFGGGGLNGPIISGGAAPYDPTATARANQMIADTQRGLAKNVNPNYPQATGAASSSSVSAYLSSQQTGAALKAQADAQIRQANLMYQQGVIPYTQLQGLQGGWSNALTTQAAQGYRATSDWINGARGGTFDLGPMAVQVNNGYEEAPAFKPGLTGGVNKSPLFANSGGSGAASVKSYNWSDWMPDDTRNATAYLWGSGGKGVTSAMNNYIPSNRGNGVLPFTGLGQAGMSPSDPFSGRRFADGGIPPVGIPSLVGERGPELFVPRQSGAILPNDRLKEVMGGGAAPVINLHDYTNTASAMETSRGANGEWNVILREAMAGMMNDPKVKQAQSRAQAPVRRGR